MKTELETLVTDDLARSGLTLEDIAGIRVVDHAVARVAIYRNKDAPVPAKGGYVIPYYDLDGKPIHENGLPFLRLRLVGQHKPDSPRYLSPSGSTSHVYIPAQCKDALAAEPGIVVLTEGEKKAIAGCKAGIPTLALPGITMYRNTLGATDEEKKQLLPELRSLLETLIEAHGLETLVVLFDSDGEPLKKGEVPEQQRDLYVNQDGKYIANPDVYFAALKLAKLIRETIPGLKVAHGWVSSAVEGAGKNRKLRKRGLDDLLVDTRPDSRKAYWALLKPLIAKARASRPAARGGFIPLGISHDSKQVILWSLRTDNLVTEPVGNLTKQPTLCLLMGKSYFESTYFAGEDNKGRPTYDTARAGREIADACAEKGVFSEESRVRGCGVWQDPDIGGLVIARRDGVVTSSGELVARLEEGRKYIYTASGRNQPPRYRDVAEDDYVRVLRRVQKDLCTWRYRTDAAQFFVLGWMLSQVFLGALHTRPSIWLTGPRGAGKSELLHYLHRALGDYSWYTDMGKESTAAGIRQALETSSSPCILDELERDATHQSQSSAQNAAGMLSLLRSAYSARGDVRKGTSDQRGKTFRIATAFALGSISDPALEPADATRIVKIYLRELENTVAKPPAELTDEESSILFWGTVRRWDSFRTALDSLKAEWRTICPGGDARESDTYGTLIAAVYATGLLDKFPVDVVARSIMAEMTAQLAAAREEASETEMFLQTLCATSLPVEQTVSTENGDDRVQRITESIGQAILMAFHHEDPDYIKALARVGLAVKLKGSTPYLAVAAKHPELAALLKGTRWNTNGAWVAAVREAAGGTDPNSARVGGVVVWAYQVPLSALPLALDDRTDAPLHTSKVHAVFV